MAWSEEEEEEDEKRGEGFFRARELVRDLFSPNPCLPLLLLKGRLEVVWNYEKRKMQ